MKTKYQSDIRAAYFSFGRAVCAGVVLLMASSVLGQNIFVTEGSTFGYEFTPGGAQSTFSSGIPASTGLAFNNSGNLYMASYDDDAIYKGTASGLSGVFASLPAGSHPEGLTCDSAGNVYAACFNGTIFKFTPGGAQSTFASGVGVLMGIVCDTAGDLFVTDWGNASIHEFMPGGAQSTFASGLNHPFGLAFNTAGNLFETDYGSGHIYEFTPGGAQSTFASGLSNPEGLGFNTSGNLFEADYGSGHIYEFTSGGTQSTFVSGLSVPGFLAIQPVPEPSVPALLAVGITGFLLRRRNLAANKT